MQRYLGIDLGGCMSGTSAYCLIEGDSQSFRILESFKEPKHKEYNTCHDFLYQMIIDAKAKAVGIDAPLSLPAALTQSSFKPDKRDAKGEIANPYLYRYTDYYLFDTYGLRPMPPAGDRIGRLTARCIQLQQVLQQKQLQVDLKEVYPKQIALELGNVHYKKEPQWVGQRLGIDTSSWDDHQIDALLAAYAIMMIDHGYTVAPKSLKEGWCYPLKLDADPKLYS